MAIIIEEEKKSQGVISLLGWISVLIMLVAAAYYLFFTPPPVVIATTPSNLKVLVSIAGSNISPATVLQSPTFQSLKQNVAPPSPTGPAAIGRDNPFVSP